MATVKVVFLESDSNERKHLAKILAADKKLEVIGMAANFMMAYMHVKLRKPDIVLLSESDSGAKLQVFINDVRKISDVPLLILSNKIISSVRHGSKNTQANIHLLRTTHASIASSDEAWHQNICQTLHKIASSTPAQTQAVNRQPAKPVKPITVKQPTSTQARPQLQRKQASNPQGAHDPRLHPLIAIGASTGGTEALTRVLSKLSVPSSAVVIVQHIPAAFGASFTRKLNEASPMTVLEAKDGDVMLQGHVYVGVGSAHFFIERHGNQLKCRVQGQQKVSGHCPSVNVLFDSVAKYSGAKSVGALLTGMGEDGATGLKKMRDARARTLAQDEKTSVVWGMPGSAVKIGAAEEEAALDDVARRLMQLAANGVR